MGEGGLYDKWASNPKGYPTFEEWINAGGVNAPPYSGMSGGGGGGGGGGPGKPGRIAGASGNAEDAWQAGADEAAAIYNNRAKKNKRLDKKKYLKRTMNALMDLQNPQGNPYLDAMYQSGAENLRNEMFASLGSSGRGRPIYDPGVGGNDVFANYVDTLSDFGTNFYGNAYNADMDRALSAGQTMMTAAPPALDMLNNQGWNDLDQYSTIVSRLLGAAPPEPQDTSSSDALSALGTGIAAYGAFASSKDYKEKVADEEGLLPKVESLDVDRWQYHADKGDGGEHIGPYAEDFHKAFGVGDGKSISVIDATGIALGAIKELSQQVNRLKRGAA